MFWSVSSDTHVLTKMNSQQCSQQKYTNVIVTDIQPYIYMYIAQSVQPHELGGKNATKCMPYPKLEP